MSEKQKLVLALESEKNSVTNELKFKLEEIRKNRSLIQRKLLSKEQQELQTVGLNNKAKVTQTSSNSSTPRVKKKEQGSSASITATVSTEDTIVSMASPVPQPQVPAAEPEAPSQTSVIYKQDKEYYELQKKRVMSKILQLTSHLEEAKAEAHKYRTIWEKVKGRIRNAQRGGMGHHAHHASVPGKGKM